MDLVKRYEMPEENTEPPRLLIQATANVLASEPMDQHGAVQHGAVQHGAVHHGAVQHGAGQHGAVQHGAAVMGQRGTAVRGFYKVHWAQQRPAPSTEEAQQAGSALLQKMMK